MHRMLQNSRRAGSCLLAVILIALSGFTYVRADDMEFFPADNQEVAADTEEETASSDWEPMTESSGQTAPEEMVSDLPDETISADDSFEPDCSGAAGEPEDTADTEILSGSESPAFADSPAYTGSSSGWEAEPETGSQAFDEYGTETSDTADKLQENAEAEEDNLEDKEKEEDEEKDEKEEEEAEWKKLYGDIEISPDVSAMDFSSCRLLVCTDASLIVDPDYMISSFNGVFLLQYPTVRHAQTAWSYYKGISYFAEPDITVNIASDLSEEESELWEEDDTEVPPDQAMDDQDNPLAVLQEELQALPAVSGRSAVVVLIDTGVSDNAAVIERVSMLGGDAGDDNGHGDRMAGFITEENPDARILSVKALDESGRGTLSGVYAAIQYAVAAGADVINLSFSAFCTEENAALADIVEEAASAGILVTGAAGNGGWNAAYCIPGNIRAAWIAGACDSSGVRLPSSNYGDSVDYYVRAETTSEASARLAGYFSRFETEIAFGADSGIFRPGQTVETGQEETGEEGAGQEESTDTAYLIDDSGEFLISAGVPSQLSVVKTREDALNLGLHYVSGTYELLYCVERNLDSSTGTYGQGNPGFSMSGELKSAISYVLAHGMQKLGEPCADPKYRSGSGRTSVIAGKTLYNRDYHITQCAIWELIRSYTGSSVYGGSIASVMPQNTDDQRNAFAKCELLTADAKAWASGNAAGTFTTGKPELQLPAAASGSKTLELVLNESSGYYESDTFSVTNLQVRNTQRNGQWVKTAALPSAGDIRASDTSAGLQSVQVGQTSYDGKKGKAVFRLRMSREKAEAMPDGKVLTVNVWQETASVYGVYLYKLGNAQTTVLSRAGSSQQYTLSLKAVVRAEEENPELTTEAKDGKSGTHAGTVGKKETITDRVSCSGLKIGRTYQITGKLMNKKDGTLLQINGQAVTSESKPFTATEEAMVIPMEYQLDSSSLQGKTVVVFEDLKADGKVIASHADLNDKAQTVWYPEEPQKTIDHMSCSFLEKHTWTVSQKIPEEIKDESLSECSFVITDTLDDRLQYEGGIRLAFHGGGELRQGTDFLLKEPETESGGTLEIRMDAKNGAEKLIEHAGEILELQFDTSIRPEAAAVGKIVYEQKSLTENDNPDLIPNQAAVSICGSTGFTGEPFVYTAEIRLVKTGAGGQPLAGAVFAVMDGKKTPVLREGKEWSETTGTDGKAVFEGLANGTWYLRETKAPEGHELLTEDIRVDIRDGIVTTVNGKELTGEDRTVKVSDQTELVLMAGGPGKLKGGMLGILFILTAIALSMKKAR